MRMPASRFLRMSARTVWVAAACLALPGAGAAPAGPAGDEPVVVDDFEAPELGAAWNSSGAELRLLREDSGQVLGILGKGPAADSLPGAAVTLPVKDLRRIGAVSFRIKVQSGPATLQVFLRKGSSCRFLEERLEVGPHRWQEVVLPLKFMVPVCYFLVPDPRELDRFEIRWEGAGGEILIDDLRLLPGDRGEESWRPSEQDLLELAFGKGQGKVVQGKHFSLLSNTADWQGPESARFLADLEKGIALVESQWGIAPPPGPRVALVGAADQNSSNPVRSRIHGAFLAEGLFPARALDRGFPPYEMAFPPPNKRAPGKPTTVGMRTYLGNAIGMGNRTWIVEALYWAYVRRACPEEFASRAAYLGTVKASDFQGRLLGKKGGIQPWLTLFDSRNLSDNSGVLLTIPEFLAACHRPKLPKVWEAVRAMDGDPESQAMASIAGALDIGIVKLEDQWLRWGATSWK